MKGEFLAPLVRELRCKIRGDRGKSFRLETKRKNLNIKSNTVEPTFENIRKYIEADELDKAIDGLKAKTKGTDFFDEGLPHLLKKLQQRIVLNSFIRMPLKRIHTHYHFSEVVFDLQ